MRFIGHRQDPGGNTVESPVSHRAVAQRLRALGTQAGIEVERSPLDEAIEALLGSAGDQDADAGIADFDPARLDALQRAAQRESEDSLGRLRCLLELLDSSLVVGSLPLSRDSLHRLSYHLLRALSDHERWHALALNAGYYREHPELAERIALALRDARDGRGSLAQYGGGRVDASGRDVPLPRPAVSGQGWGGRPILRRHDRMSPGLPALDANACRPPRSR